MILKLFAVVDRVSGIFDGPHKAVNEGQFLRSFRDNVENPDGHIGRHPEDFYAAELGTFNDATGELTHIDSGPKRIADGTDFVITDKEI